MVIDPQEYSNLESIFRLEFERFRPLLPVEDTENVEHYLTYAEIEMAFESFGLSLIQQTIRPTDDSTNILLELGLHLNLDKESVFDDNFWNNFTNYLRGVHK